MATALIFRTDSDADGKTVSVPESLSGESISHDGQSYSLEGGLSAATLAELGELARAADAADAAALGASAQECVEVFVRIPSIGICKTVAVPSNVDADDYCVAQGWVVL